VGKLEGAETNYQVEDWVTKNKRTKTTVCQFFAIFLSAKLCGKENK
jgi:hypothetical protein